MRYPGGKFRCYQKLINLMPQHRVYIETHLGGGAVLRNKAPADINIGIDNDSSVFSSFNGKFDARFQFVHGTAEEFLLNYKFAGDELVYADPPYLPETRRSKKRIYRNSYSASEHVELLGILRRLPCAVMISGYANNTYDQELRGWEKYNFMGTSHTGLREETVWLNFRPRVLHDIQYLGSTFRERQAIKRKRARWAARFQMESPFVQQALLQDLVHVYMREGREV